MAFLLGDCLLLDRLKDKGITQAEFARYMKCSRSYVSQLISGDAKMSLTFAINAAHFLECRVTDLYVLEWDSSRNE
ncbi:helix-turn-helix domain-containing protein [Paenibacillus glucanolyticus]|uniref:helix-turn-helix domain-containing protein n=1 Tax=Paenibacillus glucanolyticus TaxID=59843 RepID=UPI00128E1FE1|nr:helix-turn-helix transcriptional regulator [Mycolicibacterium fortuitum]MPY20659.1 helix-turn-helix transcriptional regulator [Paenibacillus glucanolyticus]